MNNPFKAILRYLEIWLCKRDFNRLSEEDKEAMRYLGADPETRIKNGGFDYE